MLSDIDRCDKLEKMLSSLIEWEQNMGGFDAKIWLEARLLRAQLNGWDDAAEELQQELDEFDTSPE